MVSIIFYSIYKNGNSGNSSNSIISGNSGNCYRCYRLLYRAVTVAVTVCCLSINRFQVIYTTVTSVTDIYEVKKREFFNCNTCMQGKIRTKEKCPKCQGKFIDTGKALICKKCLTMPNRFYLDIYWQGKQKVYSDKIGRPISSYELASRVLSEIRLEIEYKTFDPKDYQTKNFKKLQFKTYCREWLERYQKALKCGDISTTYYRNLINYSEEHFIPFFKIKDIREIRAGEINEFYLNLPTKLSIKTKSNIMSVLKKIFNDALIDEYIEKVPRFKKISIPDSDWKWADEELQDQILDNIPVHHLPIFIFLTRQGVRPGEARAVQWQDFDFKNDQVKISKAFSENVLRPFPKPRRNKILPLDPEVKEILQNIPVSLMDS